MELSDFEKILELKNLLMQVMYLNLSDDICEVLCNKADYYLEAIELLIDKEPAFILLNKSILNNILEIVSVLRSFASSDRINNIIISVNSLSLQPNLHKFQYITWQQESHNCPFADEDMIFNLLASDYSVYSALRQGEANDIEVSDYFMFSINYLLEMVPQFFESNVLKISKYKLVKFMIPPFPWKIGLVFNMLKKINKIDYSRQKIKIKGE